MFLDKDCLHDGQSWLGGLVTGLATSMVFVPLLSWTEGDHGSMGGMSRIQAGGFDQVSRRFIFLSLACTSFLSLSASSPGLGGCPRPS